MSKNYTTFVEATTVFLEEADWLGLSEGPACTSLMKAAEALDEKVTSTMLGEYTKVYRMLRNLKPESVEVVDELEDFLSNL